MVNLVSVAVPVPLLSPLTYRVPEDLETPACGARVVVPLGARLVTGIVTATVAIAPADTEVKDVVDILDDGAFLPAAVVELALWVAEYYACGAGDAIAAAMPPRSAVQSERHVAITDRGREWLTNNIQTIAAEARRNILAALVSGQAVPVAALIARVRKSGLIGDSATTAVTTTLRALQRDDLIRVTQPLRGRASAHRTVRVAAITVQGKEALEPASWPLSGKQRDALTFLDGAPDGLSFPVLADRGIAVTTLTRLSRRGLATIRRDRIERDPFARDSWNRPEGPSACRTLTVEQSAALARLSELATGGQFRVALLHGVTGSGKTEVYVRLARVVQAAGRSVLVLVPEIALTPAVSSTFRDAFGDRVAIQHSGLSDGERYDQWQRIRRGEVSVVVGTRSAVFAPLASPGLIVVDEEHDGSFKQEESPRYHGRDVAIMRGKNAGALVVLGSATPAVETYHNALTGRYERIALDRRVLDRPLAAVRVVSMREEYAEHGTEVILSEPLRAAIADRLTRREQALVLLNRRGLATAVFCRQCASTVECPNCSVSLPVHTERPRQHSPILRARCHYCNYSVVVPKACPNCAGPYLERAGFGTERVEAEISTLWPEARVARLDRDTARRRGAVPRLLSQVALGEIDVLVGTQMIAKGHDFPRVTLVGVISADVGLGLADFRAAERTFQLLTQVSGRAGRGDVPGEAIVQTMYPEHYSIQHARRQDYEAFFADEIRYRRAMRYPPVVGLINAIIRAPTFAQALEEATDVVALLGETCHGEYRVLGPAPAPLGRLRGEYRVQFFLKGPRRRVMREVLQAALASRSDLQKRVTVDVDPLAVL